MGASRVCTGTVCTGTVCYGTESMLGYGTCTVLYRSAGLFIRIFVYSRHRGKFSIIGQIQIDVKPVLYHSLKKNKKTLFIWQSIN